MSRRYNMIEVSRLNGSNFYLNPSLIETMEQTPDTVLTLTTDKKLIVKDTVSDIISKIIDYNRNIYLSKSRTD